MGDDPKAGNPGDREPGAEHTSPGSGPDRQAKRPVCAGRSARPTPAKTARAKPGEPGNAATVTSGQRRLILAAYEAGLKPASIAKEFRVSRATVQSVITGARRDRRNMER